MSEAGWPRTAPSGVLSDDSGLRGTGLDHTGSDKSLNHGGIFCDFSNHNESLFDLG